MKYTALIIMKIIKEGKDPRKKPMQGTCTRCDTVVEFTRDEAEFHAATFRDVEGYTVKCPICESPIWGYASY